MGSLYDRVFSEVQVRASTLGGQAGSILLNLLAFASGPNDADAETSAGEPVFGIPGVYCRPLDADATGCAEYIAARGVDDLRPLAGRDLRIAQARSAGGAVGKGAIGIAGYGGAYVEIVYDPVSKTDTVTVKNGTSSVVLTGNGRISLTTPNGGVQITATGIGAAWLHGGANAELNMTDTETTLSFSNGVATSLIALTAAGVAITAPTFSFNGVPFAFVGGVWT